MALLPNTNGNGSHWACVELWDSYHWGGYGSGGGKGTGQKPPQKPAQDPFKGVTAGIGNNNCPPDKQRFFTWLAAPLGKMAQDLNTTLALTLTPAAKEGGWLGFQLDHNQPLNNPFGVNRIAGGKAVGNISYPSLDAAIAYYKGRYGSSVQGSQAPDQYVYGLEHLPDGTKFNADEKKYTDKFGEVYTSMLKFMNICGVGQ